MFIPEDVGLQRMFNFFGTSVEAQTWITVDVEWFALETNCDHSVIFETALKYCILGSSVDYEGYSISSEGFLPAVVDIMVIWVKFTHSRPFQFTDS